MRLLVIAIALLVVLATSTSAGQQCPADQVDMAKFRQAYQGTLFAESAVRDFEEVEKRIGDLVARLNHEGEVSDCASTDLMSFIQKLEREYIVRWYGTPDGAQPGFLSPPTRTQTNTHYDSQFREQTGRRASEPAQGAQPADNAE